MAKRNPFVVFVLFFVTFGIYGIVWYAKTAGEMRTRGADIPHWILLFIPLVNLFYVWKWSAGVEKVTAGGMGGALMFLLILFLGPIGMAVAQSKFNAVA